MYYLGSGPFFYVLYAFVLACFLQTGTILSIKSICYILRKLFLLLLLLNHRKLANFAVKKWEDLEYLFVEMVFTASRSLIVENIFPYWILTGFRLCSIALLRHRKIWFP